MIRLNFLDLQNKNGNKNIYNIGEEILPEAKAKLEEKPHSTLFSQNKLNFLDQNLKKEEIEMELLCSQRILFQVRINSTAGIGANSGKPVGANTLQIQNNNQTIADAISLPETHSQSLNQRILPSFPTHILKDPFLFSILTDIYNIGSNPHGNPFPLASCPSNDCNANNAVSNNVNNALNTPAQGANLNSNNNNDPPLSPLKIPLRKGDSQQIDAFPSEMSEKIFAKSVDKKGSEHKNNINHKAKFKATKENEILLMMNDQKLSIDVTVYYAKQFEAVRRYLCSNAKEFILSVSFYP
jgi:hypothetical protein